MPLRAYIKGEEKLSIKFSDEDWNLLKEDIKKGVSNIVLPCCDQHGTLRKSSKGLKHFLHIKSQSTCDWKPESPEHLSSKIEVIKACEDNGWSATPEYAENDWRADVLAVKDDKRIAFEIQWSNQTNDDTVLRQERYKTSNVRGCWFFKTIPKQLRYYGDRYIALKEMPFFKIEKIDSETYVNFNNHRWALKEFVGHLLNGNIKFRENYSPLADQEIEIIFFDTICWNCDKPQHLYTVKTSIKSECGNDMTGPWDEENIDIHPEIISAVSEIQKSKSDSDFKIGEVKMRYSKTMEDSYLSHGCYHCDALFGDWFVSKDKKDALYEGSNITFKKKITINNLSLKSEHWCYSENKYFCK